MTIALVSNSQMTDAQKLSSEFEKENPGVKLKFISLSENQARAKITMSTAMGGSRVRRRDDQQLRDPAVGQGRLAAEPLGLREEHAGLRRGRLHPVAAGIAVVRGQHVLGAVLRRVVVPDVPQGPLRDRPASRSTRIRTTSRTWQEVADWAKTIKDKQASDAGICLRGKPGWGEVLAPLDTVINTFGGRWFDDQWNAQLNSPEVKKAVNFYVDTIKESGELGASSTGFQECANLFGQGQTAMWYDATSAVSVLEDPEDLPGPGRQDRLPARADRREAQLGLALHLGAGHPEGRQEPRRRMEVHLVDDQQGLHEAGRREAGLGARPTG